MTETTTTSSTEPSTPPVARLYGVALDSPRPAELGAFYAALLGVELKWSTDEYAGLELPGGPALLIQHAPDHVPPRWGDPAAPQQLHLDLVVDDLDVGQARALELGATLAEPQPRPDRWRVLLDPSGHPFCLCAGMAG
jgi:catechol 2,3-dioxygenase-like lactoylglutathione lyase family enzyme